MSLFNRFTRNRIDSILIWGHGINHLDDILKDTRSNRCFNILKIQKYKPRSIKRFVKEMYSFDYAPFWHLKAKTEYLLNTPKEVCYIFIENLDPDEDYLGEGGFRHKESLTLKRFKEELRDKYNPKENGQRTENHVIHATDSQDQTNHILKYLGYDDGISLFEKQSYFVNVPYYLKGYTHYEFKSMLVDKLYCRVVDGRSWDDFYIKTIKVVESPQYLGLTKDMKIYEDYVAKFLGGPLQEDYNIKRFTEVAEDFEYLRDPYQTSFVILESINDKLIILDGLHRACSHIKQGNEDIKICLVSR